jgi:hypothetical protein
VDRRFKVVVWADASSRVPRVVQPKIMSKLLAHDLVE